MAGFEIVEKTKDKLKKMLKKFSVFFDWIAEKIGNFLGQHLVLTDLSEFSDEERRYARETALLVKEYFGDSLGLNLSMEDFESRLEAMEDFGEKLLELYGLQGVEIVFTDSEEVFGDVSYNLVTYGYANFQNEIIYINAALLHSKSTNVLESVLSTMVHELRHIMQLKEVKLESDFGCSNEKRRMWRRNMHHYIRAEFDYEGYRNQALEVDARNYTNLVWMQVNGVGIENVVRR